MIALIDLVFSFPSSFCNITDESPHGAYCKLYIHRIRTGEKLQILGFFRITYKR